MEGEGVERGTSTSLQPPHTSLSGQNSPKPISKNSSKNLSLSLLKRGEIKTYKIRYLVCIAFGVNSLLNAIMWISFAPVQSRAAVLCV